MLKSINNNIDSSIYETVSSQSYKDDVLKFPIVNNIFNGVQK